MGEDVPPEKIDELFKLADGDGSGRIEFPEFVILMKGMNPKDGGEGGGAFGGFSIPVPNIPGTGGDAEGGAAAPAAAASAGAPTAGSN